VEGDDAGLDSMSGNGSGGTHANAGDAVILSG
jgi:hypothetical protein